MAKTVSFFIMLSLAAAFLATASCAQKHPYCREVCSYNDDPALFEQCHRRCQERMRED